MKGKLFRRTCIVLAVTLLVLGISALPLNHAVFRAQDGKDGTLPRGDIDPISGSSGPSADEPTGEVTVYIQLEADPVAVAYAEATGDAQPPMLRAARSAAAAASERQAEIVRSEQDQVEEALNNQSVDVLARTEIVLNSLMAVVDAEQIPDLKAIDGVLDVLVEAPKVPDNTTSIPHIGAPAAWAAGFTGAGLRIGIIDTGIDYGHRTFGTWDGTPWTGFNQGASGTKVVGGYDFAGNAYNGANAPIPDNDPRDCQGHGTHVAGTAAGYGVTAAGATFTGPWSYAAPFGTMLVGPGAAPEASLYALRVFGCGGSSSLTPLAIEWAVDPNRDGNPADHLDVINLSLGSTNGAATDASAVAANNAALVGVIVVASAGNSGDAYYVTGSPASAPYAIAVANAAEVHQLITSAGTFSGVLAEFGDPVYAPITGTLQLVNDGAGTVTDACTAPVGFTAGNIAVVDRGGGCPFTTKASNVDSVGAIGMITCNNVPGAPYMQANSATPVALTPPFFSMMISLADCNTLKAAMTGGLLVGATAQPAPQDQMVTSSSRGPSRSTGTLGGTSITLKPDIAAPGSIITSARVGTTTGAIFNGGTSMSSPHVAGVMALLRQAHPTWSVAALKALAMNSANVDLIGPAALASPPLIGAGRVNVTNALRLSGNTPTRSVIAYSSAAPERVSVSFGLVEAIPPNRTVLTQAIVVDNRDTSPVTYDVSFVPRQTAPGATFIVSPSQVTAAGGASVLLTVTLTVDPTVPAPYVLDPNAATFQTVPGPATLGAQSRHWLSEVSGLVVLQESGTQDTLRVPVYASTRPAGAVFAPSRVIAEGLTGTLEIPLRGRDVRTGFATDASPQDIRGMVSAFELVWASNDEPDTIGGEQEDVLINHADLRYVGITSDYLVQLARAGGDVTTALNRTTVYVGLATWGAWSTLREVSLNVFFDVDHNGTDDILLRNLQMGTSASPLDVFWAQVVNLRTLDLVYQAPVNEFYPSNAAAPFGFPVRNTYVLNNNVLALPVDALGPTGSVSLGLSATNTSFNFRVETLSRDYGQVDTSPTLTYNIAAPALDFTGGFPALPWWADFDGAVIPVTYNLNNVDVASGRGQYALLLHHHNADSLSRPQIVCVAGPGMPDCPVEDVAGGASAADPGGPTMLPLTGYAPRDLDDNSVLAGFALGAGLLAVLAAVALLLVRRGAQ